jgi:hypothetical protein
MKVQQDRGASRLVTAVVHIQGAAPPVTVGQAAHPDHVGPAGEEGGPQDPAPRPPRLPGVAQGRVRPQREADDDHQAGQVEQRDRSAGGAARRAEVALGEREHGRGISRQPTMNGNSLTTSAGMAENQPSLRHRVSAHAAPQDTSTTDDR